jgi:sec-independent protein translocase protein TatC
LADIFFIAPGLYRSEKKVIIPFFIASPLLFIIGSALAYYYLIPSAWRFFLSFEQHGNIPILLEARISEYLSTVLEIVIGFGIAFQLPLIMIILVKLGILTTYTLSSKRKYAIVAIFIIAAILTPPDVFSQISLAIPLLLLYEISLLICHKFENKKE